MVKRFFTLLMLAATSVAVCAQSLPDVYGVMRSSAAWGQQGSYYNPQHGFYRISTSDGQASFTRLTNESALVITDGALYANNRVYGVWTEVIKAFLGTYRSSWRVYDGESLAQLSAEASENKGVFGTSLTYDFIGGKAYIAGPKSYGSDGNPTAEYELKSVDLATGACTAIGVMGARVKGIAADPNGQLWGVGGGSSLNSTYLYKVDKTTGKATQQCALDINFYDGVDKTSLLCDMRNGALYLVAETYSENADKERTFHYGIYSIDKASGKTQCVSAFPTGELMLGCYFKQSHPKAPESPHPTSPRGGEVTFVLPTTAYDGSVLNGELGVELLCDGTTVATLEGQQPGAVATATLPEMAEGNHSISIIVSNSYGPSVPTTVDLFVGSDAPAAVSDIKVEESENGTLAQVSWTAPDMGENGGRIDPTKLSYRITRKPENKLLAEGLTACEYSDRLDRVMGVTQYQIEAVIDGTASKPAYSAICTLGTPHPIPYLQMFASQADWMSYTVVDANGDANDTSGGTWYFDYDSQAAMFFTNQKSADDYLFTPTLQLDPTKVYRLQFQAWGYHDNGSVNHLQVHLATKDNVAGVTATVMDERFTNKSQAFAYGLFSPSENDCRLAFHNISNVQKDGGYDHLFLDNILLQEYGSTQIASAPGDMDASRIASGKLRVRFAAPTTRVDGSALTAITRIDVYPAGNANQVLATIENPTPGEQYELTVTPPYTGQVTLAASAVTAEGRGMEAYAVTDTRNDIPAAVSNVQVTGKNAYTVAEITWQQSAVGVNGHLISLDDISYNIYRIVGVYRTLIAEGVRPELSNINTQQPTFIYTDRSLSDALGNNQQEYISYEIQPVTDGGQGKVTQSASTLLGRSYDLPYAESFSGQQWQTQKWQTSDIGTQRGSWTLASTGYDPWTQAQDEDYGLLSFMTSSSYPEGKSEFLSPRIDLSNHARPVLSFHLYRGTQYDGTSAALQIGVYTPETGIVLISELIYAKAETNGWQRFELEIPSPYAESDHLQIAFCGATSSNKASLHVDNISITGQRAEYEVKAERIAGAEQCVAGQDNQYSIYVRNVGSNDLSNVKVSLMAGDEPLGEQTLSTLRSSDMQPVAFNFKPSLGCALGTITLTASVACEQDGNEANNTVNTSVDIIAPMLPVVTGLEAVAGEDGVKLTWSDNTRYPRQEYVTEDCESVKPFAIDNMNGWTTIDVDGAKTAQTSLDGVTLLEWENSGDPQAWMAFSPQRAGLEGITKAHSGSQFFISFESTSAGGNDDWLISPQLSGEEQTLSFYARCFYPLLLDEQFEIWVSRSVADDINRFEKISGNRPVSVSSADKWTHYQYSLPEGSRYVAIRCVSKGQYGLMIDDISYSPMHQPLEFWGYNVYRNGQLITPEPLAEPEFVDADSQLSTLNSQLRYNVTAVYDLGESVFSNSVTVSPDGVTSIQAAPRSKAVKFLLDGVLYIRTDKGLYQVR